MIDQILPEIAVYVVPAAYACLQTKKEQLLRQQINVGISLTPSTTLLDIPDIWKEILWS